MRAPVDRSSASPLWAQVLADLRRRLYEGEFVEQFPSDQALVQRYRVSRHTVREAVRRLQAEGLLQRFKGRGSFVPSAAIEQPLGALYSLFGSVEEHGYRQHSQVRHLEKRQDRQAAAMLGVKPDEDLVYLERIRLADEEPIAIDCSWLPASLAGSLLDVDFSHTALYAQLSMRCGVQPDSGWEKIRPALATAEQRALLHIGPSQAVFAIERMSAAGDLAVEWRHSVVRGDLYCFVARWAGARADASAGFAMSSASEGSGSLGTEVAPAALRHG